MRLPDVKAPGGPSWASKIICGVPGQPRRRTHRLYLPRPITPRQRDAAAVVSTCQGSRSGGLAVAPGVKVARASELAEYLLYLGRVQGVRVGEAAPQFEHPEDA